jgi:hypothetical protein
MGCRRRISSWGIARLRRNQIDVTAKISKSTKMRRPGDRHPFKLFFALFEIFAV